jgi:hypothetical protein
MSYGDYTEPPKVPAWKIQGYVSYMGWTSELRTSIAPSVARAQNNILFRWATEEMGRNSIPMGAQVVVTSTKRVFVHQKVRARALAAR